MARGTVVNEPVVSQAATEQYRSEHGRIFGDRKPQRGRWIYDPAQGKCVPADEYRSPIRALDAPIISDRIHEGTAFHDGDRLRDLGSRRKRREFLRETGLAEATDYSRQYREKASVQREREADRRIDASAEAAARKLYHERKWRE